MFPSKGHMCNASNSGGQGRKISSLRPGLARPFQNKNKNKKPRNVAVIRMALGSISSTIKKGGAHKDWHLRELLLALQAYTQDPGTRMGPGGPLPDAGQRQLSRYEHPLLVHFVKIHRLLCWEQGPDRSSRLASDHGSVCAEGPIDFSIC